MAKEFAKSVLDNIILLINIIIYIKEAKTLKEAIKYIYKLIVEFEIAIKQKNEVKSIWLPLIII
jgi:hypothetical protein